MFWCTFSNNIWLRAKGVSNLDSRAVDKKRTETHTRKK